jgi:hypothetical protein
MANDAADMDIQMEAGQLYREETFTDRRVGSVQRLTPITADGTQDESRAVLFVGQTQVLTPAGALPLNFEIEADSLADAIAKFGASAQEALHNAMKRLEEMRRDQASSLIVPGSGGGAGNPQPGGGSGGFQLP